MAEVTITRHSNSDHPHDRLTQAGVDYAISQSRKFVGRTIVVCSPRVRTQQTAEALGYSRYEIDERLAEFEAPDINEPTAKAYVLKLHEVYPDEMQKYALKLLAAMRQYGKKNNALLITHNAIMSATFQRLSTENEIRTFDYLESFRASVG